MFPIWMNDGKTELPEDDIFYIIAQDGMYLKKTMGHFNTISKVDSISMLGECESFANLNIAKLKMRQFTQILSLFREVYKKHRSECNIILHYNKKTKRFRIEVPRQDVSGASVDYANGEETYKGYIRIGTIHSHGSMSAFHSGTDQHDEESWDGLHITLGKMDEKYFEISCSIMASSERYMVNPEDYIEGIELVEYVVERKYKSYVWEKGIRTEKPPEKKLGYISLAPNKDYKFPNKWMTKIDKFKPRPVVSRYGMYGGYGLAGFHGGYGFDNPGKIEGFHNYVPPKNFTQQGVTKGQQSLFSDLYIDENEWNACAKCPYKDHKKKELLLELINEATEEDLAELGLFFIEESKEEEDNSFEVKDEVGPIDFPKTGKSKNE